MTLVITIKSDLTAAGRGNAKSRRKAARAKKFAENRADASLTRSIASAMNNASGRTLKAINLPTTKEVETIGSICIPDVAIYQAGYREVREGATHIVS